jgi:hypothetical protein
MPPLSFREKEEEVTGLPTDFTLEREIGRTARVSSLNINDIEVLPSLD